MSIIEGTLVFLDNSVLDFMELVCKKEVEYRFHYMDHNNELIYRWGIAPHHKKKYHLHTKDGVEESRKVNMIDVLDIITDRVIENLGF